MVTADFGIDPFTGGVGQGTGIHPLTGRLPGTGNLPQYPVHFKNPQNTYYDDVVLGSNIIYVGKIDIPHNTDSTIEESGNVPNRNES